jgi:glycogen phosphorylase
LITPIGDRPSVPAGSRGTIERPGERDVERAREALAARLASSLAPFAWLAYNYAWSWSPRGRALFAEIDRYRWSMTRQNPVRLLQEAPTGSLARAAADPGLTARASEVRGQLRSELARPFALGSAERPIAFFCAEYGVHQSLPTYSGGLGVLAGDILKEGSDRALPMVGIGILYRQGVFHQQVDATGWQYEYWVEADPDRLPAVLVSGDDGQPLTVRVPLRGREVVVQIWRVDVGRIPLYLLDAQRPENTRTDRWITARLYVNDRKIRLAQYALLGIGGARALRSLGIDPGIVHLNEGHAALAPLEFARADVEAGTPFDEALAAARERTVFTTHTPVSAGNESYSPEELADVLGDFPAQLGVEEQRFLGLGRIHPDDSREGFGLTPLGIRLSRTANGVSRRHGAVARTMWHVLFPGRAAEDVPIGHVTNGVHLPTWIAPQMEALLDRHLGAGWRGAQADPATWEAVDDIPAEELWGVRSRLREALVDYVQDRSVGDRLARDETIEYAESAARSFDPRFLTLGFARRVVGYKRLDLLIRDPERVNRLLSGIGPVQLVVAGKAHPQDLVGKGILQSAFRMKWEPHVAERVAFLGDYDMGMAASLLWGCDVWVNLPRAPMEASGTSGIKSAVNGGLNVSVLDGWWAEAFDGSNGWGIPGDPMDDPADQDARDAGILYDLIENQVAPLFYDRDPSGIPLGWIDRVKSSLKTVGRFSASRMLGDYVENAYLLR